MLLDTISALSQHENVYITYTFEMCCSELFHFVLTTVENDYRSLVRITVIISIQYDATYNTYTDEGSTDDINERII